MTRTESGLAYVDITVGTGELPRTGHTCRRALHRLALGSRHEKEREEFDASKERDDSSVDRGTHLLSPGHCRCGPRARTSIAGMKTGGKRELLIPAALAFRARGAGGVIPPNATLFYEVELLEDVGEKYGSSLEYSDVLEEGKGAEPERAGYPRFILIVAIAPNAGQRSSTAPIRPRRAFLLLPGKRRSLEGSRRRHRRPAWRLQRRRRIWLPEKLAYGCTPAWPGHTTALPACC